MQARELLNHMRDYLFLRENFAPKEAVKMQPSYCIASHTT